MSEQYDESRAPQEAQRPHGPAVDPELVSLTEPDPLGPMSEGLAADLHELDARGSTPARKRKSRKRATEAAVYGGLGVAVLVEPWLLLLVVPALLLVLRD
ncbi:hypothetical protein AB0M97_16165 [Streptomyces sp. NPDC051207]|uniref:hypothetical protein n=1 Tax=Streptomyces sp. NPDC051207 TaxID=3154641 RepID=UPI00341E909A